MGKPVLEVLSPAGDFNRLIMAVKYGADAVYLAGQQFGMRAAAGNFTDDGLLQAVSYCHARGVKVYVTCNTMPRNDELAQLPEFLAFLQQAGVDAVIIGDIGVMAVAKRAAPQLPVHISTQAGIVNYESACAFHEMGASRVILARELSFEEIAEIRAKVPPALELEAFAHGSMCVSFSGRCLLSNYLTGRDANAGACAQPCRWKYHLVEEKRPGEYLQITQDGGTHILNSRDLCMIDYLPDFISAGINSLKIEGRMKSAYYTAVVTNAYRHAADAAMAGRPLKAVWRDEVNKVSHRPYSTGFFFNKQGPGQHETDAHYFSDCDVVAQVEQCDTQGNAMLSQRNKFFKGDRLTLLTPDDEPISFTVEYMEGEDGAELAETPHPMMKIRMKLPIPAAKYALLRKEKPAGDAPPQS